MTPISRDEAKAKGLKRYFTGAPCHKGHIVERHVSSYSCMECGAEKRIIQAEKILAAQQRWRDRNPGLAAQRAREWYRSHHEHGLKTRRNHYAANRSERIKAVVAWGQKNKDKRKVHRQKWDAANPGLKRITTEKRRCRKACADGAFNKSDIDVIWRAQKGKCAYCRIRLEKFHIDHIVPVALGGSNWPRNLQLLCVPCNLSKGARHPIQHAQRIGLLL